MVDALEPAACKATAMKGHSLEKALAAATKAAQEGMENTKNMVATMGKSKTLGARAIGYPDPGALSTYLILSLMTEYLLSGNS
jgi:dihydroxyacetone kinase